MWMRLILSPGTWIGAAVAAAAVGAWAVLWYGPVQYRAGGAQMALQLDEATRRAAEEITNEAERFRFELANCRQRGDDWVFDFVAGECEQRSAD